MCHHAAGEQTVPFPVSKNAKRRGENPCKVEIYTLTLYTSPLKTGFGTSLDPGHPLGENESKSGEYGDPFPSSYCASCHSVEANRCLHSDISAHIQKSNRGEYDAISEAVISEGKESEKKCKLKTILQDVVLSDALNISLFELYCCHLLLGSSNEWH